MNLARITDSTDKFVANRITLEEFGGGFERDGHDRVNRMSDTPVMTQNITEPAILIRISRLYRPGMSAHDLYEATRGVWVVGGRRDGATYAFAVHEGIVKEVYEIESWHPAGTTPYTSRSFTDLQREGRWEFLGRPAPDEVRGQYVGRSVAAYFERGNANPIMYVNC